MNEQMKTLAQLRKLAMEISEQIKSGQVELEKTKEFQNLALEKLALSETNEKIDDLTKSIKADATAECVAGYDEATKTYPKPTISGLALRVNHTLKYDIDQVTEWCKENAKLLFKLDVKEFEKMADKVDVPGVEKIYIPTITIASDLSEYLK